jgi:hypothetical protein
MSGFENVLRYGESSQEDDNSYDKAHEPAAYKAYRAGAKAAESLIHALNQTRETHPDRNNH